MTMRATGGAGTAAGPLLGRTGAQKARLRRKLRPPSFLQSQQKQCIIPCSPGSFREGLVPWN